MARSVFVVGFQEVDLHQGVHWGGRCEGTRRLGEKLGALHSKPWSGGRYQPLLNYFQVDILVNIAGVKGEQDWETVYDVNLVRTFSNGIHLFPERCSLGP